METMTDHNFEIEFVELRDIETPKLIQMYDDYCVHLDEGGCPCCFEDWTYGDTNWFIYVDMRNSEEGFNPWDYYSHWEGQYD